MSNAVNTNLIQPDVYAGLVREKIAGNMIVGQFLKKFGDLTGNVGENLIFPKYAYIGDAEDIAVGQAMDTTQMKQTTTSATIKMVAAPGVEVYDYDNVTAMGDAINEGATQQGIAIARKIDTDAIACAYGTVLKQSIASATAITQDELLAALAVYGDERNASDFQRGGLIVHSAFANSLYGMDLFVSRDKTTSADGNGIAYNNCLGTFLGINVYLSDRLYDTTGAEPYAMFMKSDSIGWIPKEAPHAEASRDASKRKTDIYCSEFYAMTLVKDDGVVLIKKTLPTA